MTNIFLVYNNFNWDAEFVIAFNTWILLWKESIYCLSMLKVVQKTIFGAENSQFWDLKYLIQANFKNKTLIFLQVIFKKEQKFFWNYNLN